MEGRLLDAFRTGESIDAVFMSTTTVHRYKTGALNISGHDTVFYERHVVLPHPSIMDEKGVLCLVFMSYHSLHAVIEIRTTPLRFRRSSLGPRQARAYSTSCIATDAENHTR